MLNDRTEGLEDPGFRTSLGILIESYIQHPTIDGVKGSRSFVKLLEGIVNFGAGYLHERI